MNPIIEFVTSNAALNIVTAIIALASAIAAVTPTPKQDSFLGKLYALIDFAAINIGKAKDEGKK
jgi:hypothetical protein